MNRLVLAGLFYLITAFSAVPSAKAVMFSDFIDFGDPGLGPDNIGSIAVYDNDLPYWVHKITDDLSGYSISEVDIQNASLRVSYRGTGGNEAWSLDADGISIGPLLATENPIFTTDYSLNSEMISLLKEDGLLAIVPIESTAYRDSFRLYEATLSGSFEPLNQQMPVIPEPVSWFLFCQGLLSASLLRIKQKN
jgi:hypothetical protein